MIYTSKRIGDRAYLILECGFDAMYYVEGDARGALIDTGVGAGDLRAYVDALATKPYDVILTHGHLDHIGAALQYPQVMLHPDDWQLARDSFDNGDRRHFIENMREMSEGRVPNQSARDMRLYEGDLPAFEPLSDGQVIDLGNRTLTVRHTPGHTLGSVCLVDSLEPIVFVGDTIIYRLLLLFGPKDPVERLRLWREKTRFLYEGPLADRAFYMGHSGIVPDVTRRELREIADLLIEDFSRAQLEGTSPKYVTADTQLYLGPPLSLQFGAIKQP